MERGLFSAALGLEEPLFLSEIRFDKNSGELHIHIDFAKGGKFSCSECSSQGLSVHDTVEKVWRHLNFFQYKCFLHFRTPRTICNDCGERLWQPPWAHKQSGFTLLFEAFIIALAKEMPVSQISELVGEHDTRIWRIIQKNVKRAYSEKSFESVEKIGCDETSVRKGHNYVTIFADMDSGDVLFATKGKDSRTIKAFTEELPSHNANSGQIKEITIDMSPAFICGVSKFLPDAIVTYDKFHVIQSLNKAQDEVRRLEQAQNPLLKNSRFVWLKNPQNLTSKQQKKLESLRFSNLKTAKVYQMKLIFQDIYRFVKDPVEAELSIKKWLVWAVRSRIEPVKKFAEMVKKHYSGILRYFTSRLTSGAVEGINSRIQEVKRRAKGFRNIDNFIAMIYLETARLKFRLPT